MRYIISRKIVCNDMCVVEATSKKEALKKAKAGELLDSWDVGDVVKDYNYKAEGILE